MPPKSRTAIDSKPLSVRQSPRKRKHEESELDSPAQPSPRKLKAVDTKAEIGSKAGENEVKQNLVLDEPGRSEIAQTQDGASTKANLVSEKTSPKGKRATKPNINGSSRSAKADDLSGPSSDSEEEVKPAPKTPRKRKTKEEKEAESMPLAPRTPQLNMFVGAHVSIAKGVENAITNAVHIGGNALALFLQSQRKWENPALKPENRDAFINACSHHKFDAKQHIVPHGSYLVNLAAKDPDQATKSYNFFLNDLKRCESLGIKYYNFHPGATNQDPLPQAISRLAKLLNKALSETTTVVPLLENMAGSETIIGSRFTDLAQIIAEIKPEYQNRIGICIDTCHTFAAGYDLRTPEAFQNTFNEIDEVVGLKYLKAMHLNDSKGMFRSKKDLHQNIGTGFLGLRAFHNIMNEPRLANIPLILETPCEKTDPKDPKKTVEDKSVWSREIKLLESLIGMDPESDEYKILESDLSEKGKAERDKMEKWQAEKETKEHAKVEKARKKSTKAEAGQKNISGMFERKGDKAKKISSDSSDSE